MHRVLIIFLCLFPLPGVSAVLPGQVFKYECEKLIDPAEHHFRCSLPKSKVRVWMRIDFVTDPTKLAPEETEFVAYQYRKTVLRFFQLGGRHYELTGPHLKTKQICSRAKGKSLVYSCEDEQK
ncbi:MAG: hypothetical protein RPU61_03555 [Candidatus Sedimenticola sp. (ex Thyasira tokunagai)]